MSCTIYCYRRYVFPFNVNIHPEQISPPISLILQFFAKFLGEDMSHMKEFDFAARLFYSPPTPSNNLGPSGKCTKLPASPIYIPQSKTIATQTTFPRHHPPKVARLRKTRIKNLKDFLDNDYNQTSDEKKKKRRLLRKKLNCYRNLRIYKTKHKVGKKATNRQIFKKKLVIISMHNKSSVQIIMF